MQSDDRVFLCAVCNKSQQHWQAKTVAANDIAMPFNLLHSCRAFKTRLDSQSESAAQKLLNSVRKRLQQIRRLEAQAEAGGQLDRQQQVKVAQCAALEAAKEQLEAGKPAECAAK